MQLRISTADGLPIYLQIANQVKLLVASGRLQAGDEIPPIRVLAEQLLVNPNTVARAYLELEREGAVIKRHGSGTYISDKGSPLARKEQLKILTQRVDALLAEARHLQVETGQLIALLTERDRTFQRERNKESKRASAEPVNH
jgi:GntR family transcriptional regulator